jgi:hypothetical protein
VGGEEEPRLLEADLLLELDRAHRGDGLEVAVERRDAHAGHPRGVLHAERLRVVVADPPDGARDVGEAAVGEAELADGGALIAGEEPPDDLPLGQRGQDRGVAGLVEQAEHADRGVDQLVGCVADGDARRRAAGGGRQVRGACAQEQLGDDGRAQDQPEAQRRVRG